MRRDPRLALLFTAFTVCVLRNAPAPAQDLSRIVKPGERVRVQSDSGTVLEGHTLAVRADTLVVISGLEGSQEKRAFTTALEALRGGPRGATYISQYLAWAEVDTVSQAEIAELWRQGNAAGTGAIAGAAVAGIGSFAFLTYACYGIGEGECDAFHLIFLASLGGAGAGALLGAAVGAVVPKWRRVERGAEFGVGLAPNGRLALQARITL